MLGYYSADLGIYIESCKYRWFVIGWLEMHHAAKGSSKGCSKSEENPPLPKWEGKFLCFPFASLAYPV